MDTTYIVTFVGNDRPGLVEQLASIIEQNGGNWLESKLSQLGGKFAGLILVSLPDLKEDALEAQIRKEMGAEFEVAVTATGEALDAGPGRDISLTVMGPDRQGIVREVTKALAQRQINVRKMHSDVVSAPMSAELMFQAKIEARIPKAIDLAELGDNLDEIANQMTLDIDWE